MDYDQFYKQHIPKTCLPSDFGGDLKSLDELQKIFSEEIRSQRPYFLSEEEQRK